MIQIFTGEPFQAERAYLKAKKALQEGGGADIDSIEGRELEAAWLLRSCRTLPFLSSRRVVVILEGEKIRKGELERLEPHVQEISVGADLLIVASKLDRRLQFWREMARVARWTDYRPLSPHELPGWIRQEGKELGLHLRSETILWLAERFGSETGLLWSALLKIRLFAGSVQEVTIPLVESLFDTFPWRSVFELTDAVGEKDRVKAIGLFRKMLLSGESPVGLLSLLARHFRLLSEVKETGRGGPPFLLRRYQGQAAKFSSNHLMKARDLLFHADWDLKSSKLSQKNLFEILILQLLGA